MSAHASTAVEIIPQLHGLLKDLRSDERKKAIAAVMILFGETASPASGPVGLVSAAITDPLLDGLSGKASAWISKNGLTIEQVENVFSIDNNEIEVIASKLPGASKKEQTVAAYVLCGFKSFLLTGEMQFDDQSARDICNRVGCYDSTNHAKSLKGLGNFVSGSKGGGWKITNPGLSEAGKIIKTLAGKGND